MHEQPATTPLPVRVVWRGLALNALLAIPTAIVISAVAGLVVAVAALPVALLQTHDLYLAILSASYGPFAAAMTLQSVIGATVLWALLHPLRQRAPSSASHIAISVLSGAGVACLGMMGATIPVLGIVAAPWRYGPALAITAPDMSVAFFAGALAGGVALWRTQRSMHTSTPSPTSSWWAYLWQHISELAWFAFPLALVLEAWAALLAAQGHT